MAGRDPRGIAGDDVIEGTAFPPSLRLRQATEFGHVFKRNTRTHDRYFTVLGRPNDGPSARLGLAISKKACKAAVGRNRIKRKIRESFRLKRKELPSLDMVVMAKPAAALATGSSLTASLAKHWQEMTHKCAR